MPLRRAAALTVPMALVVSFSFSFAFAGAQGRRYDPLALTGAATPAPLDLTIADTPRHREIPIRVYLPAAKAPAPVVLFSPGLGGSRDGYAYLGQHWSARGDVVVVIQHPGSDDAVWENAPPAERLQALQNAASLQNYLLRIDDVTVTIDQITRWNAAAGHPLAGRLDLAHLGMAGHSFGALTTQAVSGQRTPTAGDAFNDVRIRAAIAMSPSSPSRGTPAQAFGAVALPWLLMTGTKDVAPVGDADVASRLAVFDALPPGHKYEVVLDRAEHSAFSDRALPGDVEPRNPNHHRAILAISTAFWDAFLRGDVDAARWLDGDGPRGVLEAADRWLKK